MDTKRTPQLSGLGASPKDMLLLTTALYVTLSVLSFAPFAGGVEVNVAVLLPFDDRYLFSYHRVAPAIDLAIEALNKDTRLLHRQRLIVRYSDSKCNIAVAIHKAITFFVNNQVDVFFGPVCDFAVAPVARQISFWNVPLISTGAMALDFSTSRQDAYPLLTRVGPVNFGKLADFVSTVSRYFQWQKLKLLFAKGGQDYLIKSFCHLATEALYYMLKDMEPDLRLDHFKISEQEELAAEEIENVLKDEIGLEYGDITYGNATTHFIQNYFSDSLPCQKDSLKTVRNCSLPRIL